MEVLFVQPGDPRWTELLSRAEHDLYHLPEYVEVTARHEGGEPVAVVITDGRNSLMLPLVLRPMAIAGCLGAPDYRDAISPYGYPHPLLIPSDAPPGEAFVRAALSELSAAFRERRIITAFVRLHPLLDFPVEEAVALGPIVEHGETVAIDLRENPRQILAGMRENHARWIRKGLRAEHRFCLADSPADIAEFVDIYTENMAYVDASAYYFFSNEYFQSLVERLPGRVHLAFLEIDGERACGMVFSEVGGIAEYHLGGTRSRFRRQSPMVLLTYEVARFAQARDNRVLHLGGGVGGGVDSLFLFKAGFSPLRFPFRTWRIVADPKAYSQLVNRWEERAGTAADLPTGYFPAYRKPICQTATDDSAKRSDSTAEPEPDGTPLVIVGAGGHGREVLGLFMARGEGDTIAGFVDDSPRLRDCPVDGRPVMGGLNWLIAHASDYRAIVAVGDNPRRREMVERLTSAGVRFGSVVAVSASVSPFATLGEGVMVCTNAVVNSGASVGAHTIINTAATVSHDATIGSFVHVAPGAHVAGGAGVGDGVLLGTGTVVNPLVKVGDWTIVGSGAVVVSDLAPGKVAYGVPAHERRAG
jgi:sugar O-acyltransferase (sialic acid O-acetyltransferase NeuD family)